MEMRLSLGEAAIFESFWAIPMRCGAISESAVLQ